MKTLIRTVPYNTAFFLTVTYSFPIGMLKAMYAPPVFIVHTMHQCDSGCTTEPKTWQKNHWPCKHFIAIFKYYPEWEWDALAPAYTNSPFFQNNPCVQFDLNDFKQPEAEEETLELQQSIRPKTAQGSHSLGPTNPGKETNGIRVMSQK